MVRAAALIISFKAISRPNSILPDWGPLTHKSQLTIHTAQSAGLLPSPGSGIHKLGPLFAGKMLLEAAPLLQG